MNELKSKLGPILWQLPPFKKYDAEDIEAFLALLPKTVDGILLRHVLEVRHESFQTNDFIIQARKANIAVAFTDTPKYPLIADLTSDFVYLRLQDAKAEIETGYGPANLQNWAVLAQSWESGGEVEQFPLVAPRGSPRQARDVFIYSINGAKERAPAAAEAMIGILAK